LEAQQSLLEAVAPLEALSAESLTVWGSALPEVQSSQEELLAAERRLSALDARAGAGVPDPLRPVAQAVEVVGSTGASGLEADLRGLLDELASTTDTRAAAALGERAQLSAEAAEAVATGQSGAAGERL